MNEKPDETEIVLFEDYIESLIDLRLARINSEYTATFEERVVKETRAELFNYLRSKL